jgi:hypothetical protein
VQIVLLVNLLTMMVQALVLSALLGSSSQVLAVQLAQSAQQANSHKAAAPHVSSVLLASSPLLQVPSALHIFLTSH